MKRTNVFVFSLVVLGLAAAGCAGNPLRREDPRDQEIQELRARLVELQRKSAMNEVELARLRQQVAELELSRPGASARATTAPAPRPAPRTPPQAAPPPAAPLPSRSTAPPMSAGSTAPAPKPAQATPRPAAPKPAAPSMTAPIAAHPPRDIEEADIEVPPAPRTPPPAAPAPGAGENSSAATQALYDRGYTLFHQGRFVDAEASFQRFLQSDPHNELADNAQYWIGECRYSRGDFRGALSAFRETVEKYPDGNKVPDALLKAGQSLEGMGDLDGARVTYREVLKRFPGTAAATVAEERSGKLP